VNTGKRWETAETCSWYVIVHKITVVFLYSYSLIIDLMEPQSSLPHSQQPSALWWTFRNIICCYGEKVVSALPITTLEDHPLSAVCVCLFNIFAATLHIGGRSSIRNLKTRPAVLRGTRSITNTDTKQDGQRTLRSVRLTNVAVEKAITITYS